MQHSTAVFKLTKTTVAWQRVSKGLWANNDFIMFLNQSVATFVKERPGLIVSKVLL